MDPKNTPDHSDASPVISSACNRLRTYPYFRRKTDLLRVVTHSAMVALRAARWPRVAGNLTEDAG